MPWQNARSKQPLIPVLELQTELGVELSCLHAMLYLLASPISCGCVQQSSSARIMVAVCMMSSGSWDRTKHLAYIDVAIAYVPQRITRV
jgi:hypothetical protein